MTEPEFSDVRDSDESMKAPLHERVEETQNLVKRTENDTMEKLVVAADDERQFHARNDENVDPDPSGERGVHHTA